MAYDAAQLAYFLSCVPRDVRGCVRVSPPSWNQEHTFSLLEQYVAAYCVMRGANLPCVLRVTPAFAYVRLHGADHYHLYGGSYSDDELSWWADRVSEWRAVGRDVFVYFNDDAHGHAVRNAVRVREYVGG